MSRVIGQLPEIRTGIERTRIGRVVARDEVSLYLEQVFRVLKVRHQIAGNRTQRLNLAGEHFAPSVDDGVFRVPLVQVNRTVIGVNHSFHGVAHIVHTVHDLVAVANVARIGDGSVQIHVV